MSVPTTPAEHERPPVVDALNVTKRFGSTAALQDVSLRVMPGESHALVGRNGAGKSTLVRVVAGLRTEAPLAAAPVVAISEMRGLVAEERGG